MQTPSEFLREHILNSGITHITPQQVLAMAADEESPMHGYFQWDDSIAAHNYRLWQARQLIASIKITVEHKPDVEVRMMVSVPDDRGENGYMLVTEAMKNPAIKDKLLKEMVSKVQYWRTQAEVFDDGVVDWLHSFPAPQVTHIETAAVQVM